MSYNKPKVAHPAIARNELGYTRRDYEGSISTLCAGCGHDSISAALIQASYELELPPHRIAKISGIGCSSKTPTYFLGASHGFNSVHGRMPSVVTGANIANKDLVYIGVSGDGDTASIGFGQFSHIVRRRLNMLYMVENNGVYGLTKGQFSATADFGSASKGGVPNPFDQIDLIQMALQLGATYVARGFSGDKKQLVPLIKGALSHPGFAIIDCISPCVTFNNHEGSTRSYEYVREHDVPVVTADYVPYAKTIKVDYEPGSDTQVKMHDGSMLNLHKLEEDYDPYDRKKAINYLLDCQEQGKIATGMLYVNPEVTDFHDILNTVDEPLSSLSYDRLNPGEDALESVNASFR
ncbi:MAG: 2-oxoacid:ferredoxin oxidoreductase subunit beta [Gammaproteobacteria bacterium]